MCTILEEDAKLVKMFPQTPNRSNWKGPVGYKVLKRTPSPLNDDVDAPWKSPYWGKRMDDYSMEWFPNIWLRSYPDYSVITDYVNTGLIRMGAFHMCPTLKDAEYFMKEAATGYDPTFYNFDLCIIKCYLVGFVARGKTICISPDTLENQKAIIATRCFWDGRITRISRWSKERKRTD